MEKDDLRVLARNALKEPFRIRMTGGEVLDVRHHDFIAVSDYHAAIVVPENGQEQLHLATLVNISKIEMLPAAEESRPSTNGAGD